MKAALLLVAAVVAVAHARYAPAESRSLSGESREPAVYPPRRPVRGYRRSGDSASDSSEPQETTTTEDPCPAVCPLVYSPAVCVRDLNDTYHLFPDECEARKCACDTGYIFKEVPRENCKNPMSPCPLTPISSRAIRRRMQIEELEVADSSASEEASRD